MFDLEKLRALVKEDRIIWRRHALERMLGRDISRDDVKDVLFHGEQIEDYPDAFPFPAGLLSGSIRGRVIHVVAAVGVEGKEIYVISAYEPDEEHFGSDMKTRRHKS